MQKGPALYDGQPVEIVEIFKEDGKDVGYVLAGKDNDGSRRYVDAENNKKTNRLTQ